MVGDRERYLGIAEREGGIGRIYSLELWSFILNFFIFIHIRTQKSCIRNIILKKKWGKKEKKKCI